MQHAESYFNRSLLCWRLLYLAGTHASPVAAALGRRALLAPGSLGATSAACSSMNSKQLLSNGYFNKADLSDMHNMLLMASLANDVYPWSRQYNIGLLDVADGLDSEQVHGGRLLLSCICSCRWFCSGFVMQCVLCNGVG
jgi:hypothetical protein